MFNTNPSISQSGKKFNVIILASGLGTRLRPETDRIPKPLLPLDKDGTTALDHLIQKFLPVAHKIIITTAYHAEILENYVRNKYDNQNIVFSLEKVEELQTPGRSVLFALDKTDITNPTIVMFSDFIFEDCIAVDQDALVINAKPPEGSPYIVDGYTKGEPVIENDIVTELRPRKDLSKEWYGGFTGLGIFHDTLLFKAITYKHAIQKSPKLDINYDFDIVNDYVKQVNTRVISVSHLFEFGVPEMLKKLRKYGGLNG